MAIWLAKQQRHREVPLLLVNFFEFLNEDWNRPEIVADGDMATHASSLVNVDPLEVPHKSVQVRK